MAFMQEVLERIEDIVYILLYLIECIVLVHHWSMTAFRLSEW